MPTKTRAVPADDMEMQTFDFAGETYHVKKRFKVVKFMRTLNDSPIDAIELVLPEEDFERFLELEMTMDELKDFLEEMSNAMSGASLKN